MDALLGIVSVLSLTLAAGMAVIVWKLLQAERVRSDARVEALRQMAAAEWGREPAEPRPAVASADDLTLASTPDVFGEEIPTAPGQLFAEPRRESPWGARLGVAAAIAIVLIGATQLLRVRPGADAAPQGPAARTEPQAAASASGQTLELLSLHHAQEGNALTITGLVQNPRNGHPLADVVATASLYRADGTLLTSARSALDYTRLAPGDESPFLITVPMTSEVARYRIGFVGSDGRVIAHVDRRAGGAPVARRD
jgi:hypothetical protein